MSYIGYVGDKKALVETEAGFMMYVDTTDTAITPHLYREGRWEPHITSYFQNQDLENTLCIDIGANMGYYSMLFGHLGATTVWGFEPIPRLIKMCLNSGTFIAGTTFYFKNKAISDAHRKNATFRIYEDNVGASRLESRGNLEVDTIPLDSLDIPAFDYMKIDVEGHEPEALLGASETIKRSEDPKIIMEWNTNYVDQDRLERIWDDLGLQPKLLLHGEDDGKLGPFRPEELTGVEDILLHKV